MAGCEQMHFNYFLACTKILIDLLLFYKDLSPIVDTYWKKICKSSTKCGMYIKNPDTIYAPDYGGPNSDGVQTLFFIYREVPI